MVEQRVIGAKIGAPRPIAPSTAVPEHKPEGAPDGADKPKRSRKLVLVVLVVLAVVLAAAAAWFFLIHGKSTGAPEPEDPSTPGRRSMGMDLIRAFARQIRGEYHFTRGTGTRFDLVFPQESDAV